MHLLVILECYMTYLNNNLKSNIFFFLLYIVVISQFQWKNTKNVLKNRHQDFNNNIYIISV